MKVVHIVAYYPPHVGGLEYCAMNIATALAQRGVDVTVLTSDIGSRPHVSRRTRNLTVKYLRSYEFAHTPVIPGLITELFRLESGTIIHLHLAHFYSDVVTYVMAKLLRGRLVTHFHMDIEPSGRLGPLFRLYKATLFPVILRGADQVITLSNDQKRLVVKRYGVDVRRVTVIPNGVSEAFFVPRENKNDGAPLRLLFVGRLALQKNVPRLIRALGLVKHDFHLDVVGDGEMKAQITELIDRLKLKNVSLRGQVSGAELVECYASADLLVMPSDSEGMPLVLIEAMASGLPALVSDVPGLGEFISVRTGLKVGDPSPASFATALDGVAEDRRIIERLSPGARAWAERHRWSLLVGRILDLYEEERPASVPVA